MLTEAQMKQVYDSIPTNFTVDNVNFNATKIYENQWQGDRYPAIVLNYPYIRDVFQPLGQLRCRGSVERQTSNTIPATSSLSYALSIGDVASLVSVTGTKNSSPFTFDIDKITLEDDDQTITFDVTERPDVGTNFIASFNYHMIDTVLGKVASAILSVKIYAETYRYPNGPASVNGARIANAIAKELTDFFEYEADEHLTNLFAWIISDVRVLDGFLESNYRFLRQFDVTIRHSDSYVKEEIPLHRVVGMTINPTDP